MPVERALQKLNDETLRAWPLPLPDPAGDKDERGRALVVAGSVQMPGAAVLAGTAALRAGAGKVAIAVGASVALAVAIAVPEARVIALPEKEDGAFAAAGVEQLAQLASNIDALLIGPGMQHEAATCDFVRALLPRFTHCPVVLDALAMGIVSSLQRFDQAVLLTPHVGEMAHLSGHSKDEVCADPLDTARRMSARWNALVALKGSSTIIVSPDGRVWQHDGGDIGLATSGSGDTLAGIIVGLAARGVTLEQACAWGVVLHASAGAQLAREHGQIGYLARELSAQVPRLLERLRR
jgi:hydroxyethylthiazole kinase-like uncharacterized protein yjeF